MTLGPAQVQALACPHDATPVHRDGGMLRCTGGHAFDLARQGYVNLVVGRDPGTGDDAAMVAAREEALGRRLLVDMSSVVGDQVVAALEHHLHVERDVEGVLVDLGGGTGHHLAAVLDRLPRDHGLVLDLSKPAAKRAARRHPRLGAVVADVWQRLPLRDGSAAAVLCVFAPRNAPEIARVLRPDGILVVATPRADHLGELVGPLGLVGVDPRKDDRLAATFAGHLVTDATVRYRRRTSLDHDAVRALVAMGPSAAHIAPDELDRRVARLPDPVTVTLAADVRTYRPR